MAQEGGPCLRGHRLLDNAPCQAAAGLDSGALLFPRYCASLVQTKADRHAKGSPFGGAGERSETERARPLTANPRHSDSIALTKSLPIAVRRLFPAGLALSVTFGDTARVAAPSVCFAAARILLAAAPTAPPCFRHWRRSSPLLPKGEALASRKAQKIPRGGRNSLGDFSLLEMKALGSHISVFIICDSPQKSSTSRKH